MASYRVFIEDEAQQTGKRLPGNIRQRIKRMVDDLAQIPRPLASKALTLEFDLLSDVEIRRVRLDHWRIVYAVNDHEQWVWILAIRQRPPYDYSDLTELLNRID